MHTIHALHRASQVSAERFAAHAADDTLTPRQLVVLDAVNRTPGLSQTGIVEATGVDRSTLADIVRRLIRKGLLRRSRMRADARAYAVQITDAGKTSLKLGLAASARAESEMLAALSQTERALLQSALHKIAAAASGTAVAPQKRKAA